MAAAGLNKTVTFFLPDLLVRFKNYTQLALYHKRQLKTNANWKLRIPLVCLFTAVMSVTSSISIT